MKKVNTKPSAKKKLIPAAGSLLISAAMLGTSTYAWFTMSREVEVQNIQMTATVPEDIQISLGKIYTDGSETVSTANGVSLAYGTGWLKAGDSGEAEGPRGGSDAYNSIDWSNTADISHYYTFGRLIPASSDTGEDIFFTPDANGIGQTVKVGARYFQAADGLSAESENGIASGTSSGTFKATSHINAQTNTGAWAGSGTGTRSTDWNYTNDDGYYIDIPVWLRTSSTAGADVKVKAYVIDRNPITPFGTDTSGTTTNKELYRAVRVAILDDNGGAAAASGTGNLIQVKDGGQTGENGYTSGSILDWYNPAIVNKPSGTNPMKVFGGAVNSVDKTKKQGDIEPNYTLVNALESSKLYDGEKSVAHLGKGQGNTYGDATKVIIRVWLEGEDPDCYNETAGQDWSINLMFEKID